MAKILISLSVLILGSIYGYSQTDGLYINYANGGLCSSSIMLNIDGTYNYEGGCEHSSHVSFGTWIKKGDTIKFRQVDIKDFKILKIVSSRKKDEKILTVKVFDQTGENITEKILLGQFVKDKGVYNMPLDFSKTKRTDFIRDSGSIIFKSFERLLNKTTGIKVNNNNYFEITLNIPNEWIYKIDSKWINIGDFELVKNNNALISTIPDSFDEKGNLIKTVYNKYQKQL